MNPDPHLPIRPHLDEYPFKANYFYRADGLALHYVDEGRGQAVLMVHGNPSWSFLWRRLIRDLSPSYRCLAPDHLGMGFSSRPMVDRYGFTLAERIDDLEALVDSLNLDRPLHLLVHDWGGPIGLGWAGWHPAKVASITILNTGTRIPAGYRLPVKLALFKMFTPLGACLTRHWNLFAWGTAVFGVTGGLSPAARAGFLAPYRSGQARLAIARFVEDIPLGPRHPSFESLARVDRDLSEKLAGKPLQLIWGLKDFVFNRTVFLDWRQRYPGAPALVLPEAGHYLLEDEPDRVSARVRRFLASPQEAGL